MSDSLAYDYPSDVPVETYYMRQDVSSPTLDVFSEDAIACIPAKYFVLCAALMCGLTFWLVLDILNDIWCICFNPRRRVGEPIKI